MVATSYQCAYRVVDDSLYLRVSVALPYPANRNAPLVSDRVSDLGDHQVAGVLEGLVGIEGLDLQKPGIGRWFFYNLQSCAEGMVHRHVGGLFDILAVHQSCRRSASSADCALWICGAATEPFRSLPLDSVPPKRSTGCGGVQPHPPIVAWSLTRWYTAMF